MNVKSSFDSEDWLVGAPGPLLLKGSGIFQASPAERYCGVPTYETAWLDQRPSRLMLISEKITFVQFKFMISYAVAWLVASTTVPVSGQVDNVKPELQVKPKSSQALPKGNKWNGRKQQPRQISVTDFSRCSATALWDAFSFQN